MYIRELKHDMGEHEYKAITTDIHLILFFQLTDLSVENIIKKNENHMIIIQILCLR